MRRKASLLARRYKEGAAKPLHETRPNGESERSERTSEAETLEDRLAVHFAERIADQLEPGAVGVEEVQRRPVDVLVRHAGSIERVLQMLPPIRRNRDREVVEAAEHLAAYVGA